MQRLHSLFWGAITALALLGMLSSIAGPAAFAGPIVRITEPTHGQVVQGQILINVAFRTDSNRPIVRLDLLIDEQVVRQYALATPRLEGSQAFSWDFTTGAGTQHSISARAVDQAGEVGSATITVTVTGASSSGPGGQDRVPPVINIYYPAQGAELSDEVEIKAEASDNVGVKYVFFYIDGKLHKMIMNAPPYVDLWDTTHVSDGAHVLRARAMDEAENSGSSAEVTVFVRNHDMTAAPAAALQTLAAAPAPSAPVIAAQPPTISAQPPTIASSVFGRGAEEQPTTVAAVVASQAQPARVGYVPPITDSRAEVRTSSPRMLAALPRPVERPGEDATVDETAAPGAMTATGAETQAAGPMLASAEFMPRTTAPRMMPAEGRSVITPLPESVGAEQPFTPQLASAELAPRITMPRMMIEAAPSVSAAAVLEQGHVTLEPALEVRPNTERLAARTTMPGMLTPSEVLAPRETVPDVLVVAPEVGFGERSDLAGTTRIAVLPERATRAAIPLDGRITRPGGPAIAPVAAMSFEDVQVLFNSKTLDLLAQPEMREGISIAPLREIFEASDGVLYWYPVEKRVRAVRAGSEMQLTIGNPAVQVNQETRVLEVAPYIKQGRTMVPLQFIADTLNVTVSFNPGTGQICLTSNDF